MDDQETPEQGYRIGNKLVEGKWVMVVEDVMILPILPNINGEAELVIFNVN